MSRIRVTTAWLWEKGEDVPEMFSAYDEWTGDAWNGTPEFHEKAIAENTPRGEVREIVLLVDFDTVAARFTVPEVEAEVEG